MVVTLEVFVFRVLVFFFSPEIAPATAQKRVS